MGRFDVILSNIQQLSCILIGSVLYSRHKKGYYKLFYTVPWKVQWPKQSIPHIHSAWLEVGCNTSEYTMDFLYCDCCTHCIFYGMEWIHIHTQIHTVVKLWLTVKTVKFEKNAKNLQLFHLYQKTGWYVSCVIWQLLQCLLLSPL